MLRLPLLLVLAGTLAASTAHAQGNDLYGPAGGRAALMGNTGVALARDGSAPFYNPATIVRILDERLSFSAHFYSLGIESFADWHEPAALDEAQFGRSRSGDTGLVVSSFHSLPSSVCLFLTLEELADLSELQMTEPGMEAQRGARQKLAFCFASLESEDVDLEAIQFEGETDAGPTSQIQAMQHRWSRLYLGPTYSAYVHDDFALGASVQVVYSYTSFGLSGSSLSATLDGGGIATAIATSGRGHAFDLTAIVGATYRYRDLTFGLSVRAPSLHLGGSYNGAFSRSMMGSDDDESLVARATGSFRTSPPIRIAAGAGYARSRWRLELDAALCVPMQDLLRAELEVTTSRLDATGIARSRRTETSVAPSRVVLNPSAGAEYFVRSDFSLMAGVSANFSGLSSFEPYDSIGNLAQARMNHVSASFGIGSYWEGGELLFGAQFDYGWGDALALNPYALPNAWAVVDSTSYTVLFVISGASSLHAIARVVNRLTESED